MTPEQAINHTYFKVSKPLKRVGNMLGGVKCGKSKNRTREAH